MNIFDLRQFVNVMETFLLKKVKWHSNTDLEGVRFELMREFLDW